MLGLSHADTEKSAIAPLALFNGKNLEGWTQRGGKADYQVIDQQIVGVAKLGTPNSFLCTKRTYGDFILEYEFNVDTRLNSGVQIRSNCYEEETSVEWNDKTIRIPAGRVHGYQVEIDPDMKRNRHWSAGIYDEARRGWLFPNANDKSQQEAFSAVGRETFKPGAWNRVRVEAIGDTIRTWLNGQPRADLKDSLTAEGFIALQVHSIGDPSLVGAEVRWRNLQITELQTPASVTQPKP